MKVTLVQVNHITAIAKSTMRKVNIIYSKQNKKKSDKFFAINKYIYTS